MKKESDSVSPETKEQEKSFVKELLSWIEVFAVAIILALLINNFIIVNARIPSGSMENTIHTGDRLIGARFSYWFSDPERGDIVVFRYPVDEAKGIRTNYIKRIIGLPGETLEIKNAKVYINGSETPLDEPYLKEEWVNANDGMAFQIPEDSYLMMGDNRNNSKDSRYWAAEAYYDGVVETPEEALALSFVKRNKILGKAYFRYWPLNKLTWFKDPVYE